MTQVKIDIGKLDANGIVDLANDPIIITPTKRFTTSTKKIIVNEPLKTTLDQHGAITLNLPPTGTDWAYQLTIATQLQGHLRRARQRQSSQLRRPRHRRPNNPHTNHRQSVG